MKISSKYNRRNFLKQMALAGGAMAVGLPGSASASTQRELAPETMGVLVDLSRCIGCRKCEFACNQANDFDKKPVTDFESKDIFKTLRVHGENSFTVVNQFQPDQKKMPVYTKRQCFHCNDPACLSACLVTAFRKDKSGAVAYDAGRCMGCRYCMVACPFEIPTFQYSKALTGQIRKCTFCLHRTADGKLPACIEICPVACMMYGKRSDLINQAKLIISGNPGHYIDHIYGEHEMGGTSWMYIGGYPFDQVGFQDLPSNSPPRLVEGVQHGTFKYFLAPAMLYAFLGGIMWNFRHRPENEIRKDSSHE
jgi:formate dehydrogenase iron-sulfur subunit